MESVESITWEGEPLAYIIRSDVVAEGRPFATPPGFNLQVGSAMYPAAGEVAPSAQAPLERHIVGTNEVLIIKKGRCEVDIYNKGRQKVATRELREGDIMLTVGGGHGFHMLEDTVLLEVKQGPYMGIDEKERF